MTSTKNELSEEIMDLLGIDLESLTAMTKEDLVKLHQRLSGLSGLKLGGELFDKPLKDLLNETVDGKPLKDMTQSKIDIVKSVI